MHNSPVNINTEFNISSAQEQKPPFHAISINQAIKQKTTLTVIVTCFMSTEPLLKHPTPRNLLFRYKQSYAQISGLKRTATWHLHHTCTPWWNVNVFEGNTQTNPTIYIAVFVIFLVHTLHVTSGAAIFTLVMYRIWLPRKRSFLQTTGFQHPTTNSIS